jgi:hypothetical protein
MEDTDSLDDTLANLDSDDTDDTDDTQPTDGGDLPLQDEDIPDDYSGTTANRSISAIMASEAKERARAASKPYIDHLKNAVITNEHGWTHLALRIGERIIVERYATILDHKPWLDTKIYTITAIDEQSGNLSLHDEEFHHNTMSNYLNGSKLGYRFKIPPTRGRWDTKPKLTATGEIKITLPQDPNAPKKRRGRPAGVKNRPKTEVAAEKAAKREEKKLKAARRATKKAGKKST